MSNLFYCFTGLNVFINAFTHTHTSSYGNRPRCGLLGQFQSAMECGRRFLFFIYHTLRTFAPTTSVEQIKRSSSVQKKKKKKGGEHFLSFPWAGRHSCCLDFEMWLQILAAAWRSRGKTPQCSLEDHKRRVSSSLLGVYSC